MIGQRIRLLRKMKNMTQADLADSLDVAKTTISAYENEVNEPNHEMLKNLANLFNVSVDYLIGRTDSHEQDEVKQGLKYSDDQLKKIDELHEILLSIDNEEARNMIIQSAITYANGMKISRKS